MTPVPCKGQKSIFEVTATQVVAIESTGKTPSVSGAISLCELCLHLLRELVAELLLCTGDAVISWLAQVVLCNNSSASLALDKPASSSVSSGCSLCACLKSAD